MSDSLYPVTPAQYREQLAYCRATLEMYLRDRRETLDYLAKIEHCIATARRAIKKLEQEGACESS